MESDMRNAFIQTLAIRETSMEEPGTASSDNASCRAPTVRTWRDSATQQPSGIRTVEYFDNQQSRQISFIAA
jgi:hypothetical protein